MKVLSHLPGALQDVFYTVAGALVVAFALKSFLVPNDFLDGGVTGVSLLLHEVFHFNLGLVIVLANIPFIIAGASQVNRKFALETFACGVVFALCLEFFPYQLVTSNTLLVSIFGGFFLGLGIGLAMRG